MVGEVNSDFRETLIRQLENQERAFERLEAKVDQLRVEKLAEIRTEINDARRESASAVSLARADAASEIARVRSDAAADAATLRTTTSEKLAALQVRSGLWGGMSGGIAALLAALAVYVAKGGH